ncbi:MAG: DUF2231 domain-containing protein [Cyclobacteriaceae bacterium]
MHWLKDDMRLLGHPVHLMLVHFPAAIFPLEAMLYAAYCYTDNVQFANSSFFVLMVGVPLGWLAAICGGADVMKINPERTKTLKRAVLHGSINTFVLICFTVVVYKQYLAYPILSQGSLSVLGLKVFLVLVMIGGNFIGGSLVLKHKVGIEITE